MEGAWLLALGLLAAACGSDEGTMPMAAAPRAGGTSATPHRVLAGKATAAR